MKLHYCSDIAEGNFGDDMNSWFWDEAFPNFREIRPGTTMFGIGSILWKEDIEKCDRIMVMGSGAGVGVLPKIIPDGMETCWVRGPMTAKALDLDVSAAVTDGACLVPRLPSFSERSFTKTQRTVFVPHVSTALLPVPWEPICDAANLSYVSPCGDSKAVISEIAGAPLVVTESLHGAIIADAFRVPWVPVSISPKFATFKWLDWAKSMELDIEINSILRLENDFFIGMQEVKRVLTSGKRLKLPSEDPNTKVRFPQEKFVRKNVRNKMSQKSIQRVRSAIGMLGPVFKPRIASELRRISRAQPYLSEEAVLAARQDEIERRISVLAAAEGD